MQTNLILGPEILILIFNKGMNIEIKLNFNENINLENYIEYKKTGFLYKLIGVVVHINGNNNEGIYISFCKDPISEKWNKYNNINVTPVNDFEKEVNYYNNIDVLFYQKNK